MLDISMKLTQDLAWDGNYPVRHDQPITVVQITINGKLETSLELTTHNLKKALYVMSEELEKKLCSLQEKQAAKAKNLHNGRVSAKLNVGGNK